LTTRYLTYNYIDYESEIDDYVNENVDKYLIAIPDDYVKDIIYDYVPRIVNGSPNAPLNYDAIRLHDSNAISVTNPIFDIYPINNDNGKCFFNTLKYLYKDLYKKEIDKLDNNLQSLKKFTENHSIGLYVYDITGTEIYYHCCTVKTHKLNVENKNIKCMIHNNHIYLLRDVPSQTSLPPLEQQCIVISDNLYEIVIGLLKNKIEPYNLVLSNTLLVIKPELKSFCTDNTMYVNNPDYYIILEIISRFKNSTLIYDGKQLSELFAEISVTPYTTISTVMQLILKAYSPHKTYNSTFPESNKFVRGGYNYNNNSLKIGETRDMNKSYPFMLKKLPFLITCNYMNDIIRKYNGEPLVNHYLYVVHPLDTSILGNILLPDSNLYSGYFLKIVIEHGILFTITEYLITEKHDNIFKDIISHIEELFPFAKNGEKIDSNEVGFSMMCNAICMFIGQTQTDNTYNRECEFKYDRICNEEECSKSGGEYLSCELGDGYFLRYRNNEKISSIINRKPIGLFVYDLVRYDICNYVMKYSRDGINKIKQIRTDAVTIEGKFSKCSDHPCVFGGYKTQAYNPLNESRIYGKNPNLSLSLSGKYSNAKLYRLMAGAGKTHSIIEIIGKDCKDRKVIVLSPSHKSLKEYREKGIECDVVQRYTFKSETHKQLLQYDTIICDEIGMFDHKSWLLIIKLIEHKKMVICLGDFRQLPPVGTRMIDEFYDIKDQMNGYIPSINGYIGEHFLRFLFNTIIDQDENTVNYRNNFKWSYYEDILNGRKVPLDEVLLHSIKIEDINDIEWGKGFIVTWSKKVRDSYNRKILDSKRYKDHIEVGVPIIADLTDHRDNRKNNNLSNREIYNSQIYTITEINTQNGQVTLNADDTIKIVSIEEVRKYFIPAYAINIYKLQGSTIKSYYWAPEDNWILKHNPLRNIIAYVIISRLYEEKK